MKRKLIPLLAALLGLAALAAVLQQSAGIYVLNTTDGEIKLKLRSASSQTAPFIEVTKGNSTVFSVSADGVLSVANAAANRAGLGILSGTITNSADNTVTNTFSAAFSAAPVVTVSAATNDLPHVISVSSSAVIFGGAASTTVFRWIAVGAP